jgi:CheY-like chemotaxis protein
MRNRTVLLVDSSTSALAHARTNLEFEGLEVLEARDGDEALDLANVHVPALVIVSLGAPGLNGYDLCRALADDDATRDARVVLTHGSMDVLDAARAEQVGCAASLARPYLPRQLLATILGVMGKGFLVPLGTSMEIDRGQDSIPDTEVFLSTAESDFLEDTQDDTFTLSSDLIVDADELLGEEPTGGGVGLLDRGAGDRSPAIPLGRRALQVLVERAVQAHLERVLPDLVERRVDEVLARRKR